MTLSVSLLILAVVAIRALFLHRVPKVTFLALWGIVVCRLLVPFSVPSRFSVYTLLDRVRDMVTEPVGTSISTGGSIVSAVGTPAPAASSALAVSPVMLVWLSGVLICALFFAVTHVRCLREYRTALPVANDFVTLWQREHPLRRSVRIRQLDTISAPLTYGFVRPVVLLPKTTEYADEEQLGYVLAHEYTHVRRFDALAKWLLAAALCVHWFNPLVWVMYVLANRDIELACDEAVVRTFGEATKSAYARALIGMEEKKSRLNPFCNGFGKIAIEERIVAIMKTKRTTTIGIVLALALVVGTATAFATSAMIDEKNRDENTTHGDVGVSTAAGMLLSRLDEDTGNVVISMDNGRTWMSEEDYARAYPTPEVEWWTYDEYKEWLDNEKIQLQSIIGGKGWNPTDGWYVWTQEKVDKTVKMYEGTLEDIKNGMKLSKTVDGSDEIVMSYYQGDIATSYGVCIVNDEGKEVLFGPYDTEEELLAQVRPYCEAEVRAGNMTRQEADEILSRYQ
jgi:beta-lactamase regulating signal transducer with metallopeptidase domain